ncbi:MAG: methyltransferase domain-containing protein [Acidimicrobiia bacterium]|nr:methyltransferase domain-containing protein [Acidimicrobiia bacterium]
MTSGQWDERYRAQGLVWTADPNRFLVEAVAGLEPGSALDLACGEGRNAVWLAANGWRVTGVDFSPVGLDKARLLAAEAGVAVDWELADVTAWEAPARHDLVIVLYLHLDPPGVRAALRRAVAAVAPGGRLLVVGHAVRNLTDGYGGPPDPALLYEPEQIAGELGDLSVERAEEVLRPVEVDGAVETAIDALVLARRT